MKFDRRLFKEAYKAGYKRALTETAFKMNYVGDTSNGNSTIDSGSFYDNDQYFSQTKTPAKKKSIPAKKRAVKNPTYTWEKWEDFRSEDVAGFKEMIRALYNAIKEVGKKEYESRGGWNAGSDPFLQEDLQGEVCGQVADDYYKKIGAKNGLSPSEWESVVDTFFDALWERTPYSN